MSGHPIAYRPAFCAAVVEVMGEGLSLTGFAGEIGISRATAEAWMAEHPEFAEAARVGQAKRTAFLERGLLEGGPNTTARILALKSAAPEEWKDKGIGGGEEPATKAGGLDAQELTIRFVDGPGDLEDP